MHRECQSVDETNPRKHGADREPDAEPCRDDTPGVSGWHAAPSRDLEKLSSNERRATPDRPRSAIPRERGLYPAPGSPEGGREGAAEAPSHVTQTTVTGCCTTAQNW
jgi:hypothetical protein